MNSESWPGREREIDQATHEGSLAFPVKVVSRGSEELSTGSDSKLSLYTVEVAGFEQHDL